MMRRNSLSGLLILILIAVGMGALLLLDEQRDDVAPIRATTAPTAPARDLFGGVGVDDITAIQLVDPNSGRRLALVMTTDDEWIMPEAPARQIDQRTARLIARTVADMPYQRDFIAEQALSHYGFRADGAHSFSVFFITRSNEEHAVLIGNPTGDIERRTPGAGFYALVDEREALYIIPYDPIFYLIDQMLSPPVE